MWMLPANPREDPDAAARPGAWVAFGILCLGWAAAIFRWEPLYLLLPVDDSFYYLKTAANIAGGHGATFDQVNPTNGFHPLWMLVLAGISGASGAPTPLFMRLALCLQLGLLALGAVMLVRARVPGSRLIPWAACLLLLSFYATKTLVNGQESALWFAALCATLAQWWRLQQAPNPPTPGQGAALGVLAGITVLARLDAALFAVVMGLAPALWPGHWQGAWGNRERLWTCGVAGLCCGLVVAPYLWWNVATFGHLLPVSGAIKTEAFGRQLAALVGMWAAGEAPYAGRAVVLLARTAAAGALPLMAAAVFAMMARRRDRTHARGALMRWLAPLAVYVGLFACHNALRLGSLLPGIWYAAPYALLALLAACVAAEAMGCHRTGRAGIWVALLAYAAVAGATWWTRLNPETYSPYLAARRSARWIQGNTAPDALLAGWDCGIVAAHCDRRFMNLEGLMNSWEYKTQYLDTGRTQEFIEKVQPVDYVAQYFRIAEGTQWDGRYSGVDLSAWAVVHEEAVRFRSVGRGGKERRLVFMVLKRPGG